MRLTRLFALPALLGVALAGGCTGEKPSKHVPYPTLESESAVAEAPGIELALPVVVAHPQRQIEVPGRQAGNGDLVGLSVRFKLRWRVTTDRLPASAVRLLKPNTTGPVSPILAPAGRELVAVQVDSGAPDKFGRQPGGEVASDAAVSLVVGDQTVPVNEKLENLDVLIVNAPKGAPVLVKLTEYGRTQSMDLRTGAPGPDVVPGMTGPRDLTVPVAHTTEGTVTSGGVTRPFKVGIEGMKGELQPYLTGLGWAAPGRQWMVVRVRASGDGAPVNAPPNWFWVTFVFDAAQSFTVALPSGERVSPRSAPPVEMKPNFSTGSQSATVTAVFDVPAGVTAATLRVTVTGTTKALYGNGQEPVIRWNRPTTPVDVAVSSVPF